MPVRFISDLHLSPARPDITRLFLDFLQTDGRASSALYILGDLFDAWLGDDDNSDFANTVRNGLKELTALGVPVYFMAGNRDFLIGERFADQTGVVLLEEGHIARLYERRALLLHGDSLCTDDHSYQRFRRIIRAPLTQALLTRLPLRWRMGIATKLRASSNTQQPLTEQRARIMDVNEKAVQTALMAADVDLVIHGHTHRPAIHQLQRPDGVAAQRVVLGDWYEQGSILEVRRESLELINQPLPSL